MQDFKSECCKYSPGIIGLYICNFYNVQQWTMKRACMIKQCILSCVTSIKGTFFVCHMTTQHESPFRNGEKMSLQSDLFIRMFTNWHPIVYHANRLLIGIKLPIKHAHAIQCLFILLIRQPNICEIWWYPGPPCALNGLMDIIKQNLVPKMAVQLRNANFWLNSTLLCWFLLFARKLV